MDLEISTFGSAENFINAILSFLFSLMRIHDVCVIFFKTSKKVDINVELILLPNSSCRLEIVSQTEATLISYWPKRTKWLTQSTGHNPTEWSSQMARILQESQSQCQIGIYGENTGHRNKVTHFFQAGMYEEFDRFLPHMFLDGSLVPVTSHKKEREWKPLERKEN